MTALPPSDPSAPVSPGGRAADPAAPRGVVRFGDCRFDPGGGLLWKDGHEIALTPRTSRLLEAFLDQPGTVLGRSELLQSVWDGDIVEEDALTQAVSLLRTALGDDRRDPRYIQTMHGRGYRFVADVEHERDADATPGEQAPGRPGALPRLLTATALVVIAATVTWSLIGWRRAVPGAGRSALRYAAILPDGFHAAEYSPGAIALSPDGRTVVIVGYDTATSHILVKGPDDFGLHVLDGTEAAYGPFFSPDGRQLAFFEESTSSLVTLDLDRGTRRVLTAVTDGPFRGTWAADGSIYFTEGRRGLVRIPASGGDATVIRAPAAAAGETRFLDVERAGHDRLLLTVGSSAMTSWNEARVELLDLDTGATRTLVEGGLAPRLVGDTLLFARQGEVLAARLGDAGPARILGPVVDDVSTLGLSGAAQFAVSTAGDLAFLPGGERDIHTAVSVVDADGLRRRLELRPGPYISVGADPAGGRIALWNGGDFGHVWTYDLERQTLTRQTRDWQNMAPVWRPGTDQIVYTSARGGRHELRLKDVADSGPGDTILSSGSRVIAGCWSPDGGTLLFTQSTEGGGHDIRALDLESGDDRALVAGRYDERAPALSPDGRWLAYTSDESGERQIYLTRIGEPSVRLQVSAHGGSTPRWRPDGSKILYVSRGSLMQVRIEAAETPSLGAPETILEGPLLPSFDTLRDGGIVFIEEPPTPPPVGELRLILGGALSVPETSTNR